MATALLIDAADGSPMAPMGLSVLCSLGMYSTESKSVQPPVAHLDQVLSWMEHSNSWNLGRRPVFVIDREADSGMAAGIGSCDYQMSTGGLHGVRHCVGVATSDDARSREVQVISRTSERSSDETQASRDGPRPDVRPAPAADYAAGTGISHSRTTSGLRQSRRSWPAIMTWFV